MRTTLTLDEDVADKLKRETARSGRSFRETVNLTLRAGLSLKKRVEAEPPFRIDPLPMGVYPHLDYDNIGELLEVAEKANDE